MAQYPCDQGLHRYRGPQRTMYPAIVNHGTAWRRKLRLCQAHFEAFHLALTERAQFAQMDFEDAKRPGCYSCNNEVTDSSWAFFLTSYDHGQDREDWWAPLHEGCAASAAKGWLLDLSVDS